MRIRKSVLAVLAALCIVLSACASVEEAPPNSTQLASSKTSNSSVAVPGNGTNHIKKQLSTNLSVDADVVLPKGVSTSKADILTAKYRHVDTALLYKNFFSKKKVKQHSTQDGDSYQATDNSYLNNFEGSIYFGDGDKPNIHYAFFPDPKKVNEYNADQFSETSNLEFETRKNAAAKVIATLSSFGIKVNKDYSCYSLDHQTLQKQQDAYVKRQETDKNLSKSFEEYLKMGKIKLKKTWTSDDDCYYFRFHQEFNSIPVTNEPHGNADEGAGVPGTDITVLYTKAGIVDLLINSAYESTGVAVKGAALLDSEKALQAVKNKYDAIILSNPTVVKKISLNYAAVLSDRSRKNFKLTPVWIMNVSQIHEETNRTTGKKSSVSIPSAVMIDAVTGKEIL